MCVCCVLCNLCIPREAMYNELNDIVTQEILIKLYFHTMFVTHGANGVNKHHFLLL